VASIIFLVAALTDWWDGKIARKHSLITDFGKLADPLADKFLTTLSFITFIILDLLNPVIIGVVIFRDIVVTGFRLWAVKKGLVIAASKEAKGKTTLQFIILGVMIVYVDIQTTMLHLNGYSFSATVKEIFYYSINLLAFIMMIMAVKSGLHYLLRNKELFGSK
jgi:CDP-diacylglycerol--glycerol-3-phosphate 3-phosphatidyltransferase